MQLIDQFGKYIFSGVAIVLFVMLMLTGCDTEYAVLLTDGVWTFEDMSTDSEESNIISLVSLGEALLTNATMEFQEGGTYILTSPFVETPTTGEWQLIGEDQLILDPGDETSSVSIIDILTRDKLSYTEDFVDGQLIPYKVTTTWTK